MSLTTVESIPVSILNRQHQDGCLESLSHSETGFYSCLAEIGRHNPTHHARRLIIQRCRCVYHALDVEDGLAPCGHHSESQRMGLDERELTSFATDLTQRRWMETIAAGIQRACTERLRELEDGAGIAWAREPKSRAAAAILGLWIARGYDWTVDQVAAIARHALAEREEADPKPAERCPGCDRPLKPAEAALARRVGCCSRCGHLVPVPPQDEEAGVAA